MEVSKVWAKALGSTSPSSKNVHLQVTGWVDEEGIDWELLVSASDSHAGHLRLDSVTYSVAEKAELLLAWDNPEGSEPHVFLPLSGRGFLNFDPVNGLQNTVREGRTGDVLLHASSSGTGRRHFTLALDFSKQGV